MHSPSQSHPVLHGEKRKWNDGVLDDDVDDIDVLPKTNVSTMCFDFRDHQKLLTGVTTTNSGKEDAEVAEP